MSSFLQRANNSYTSLQSKANAAYGSVQSKATQQNNFLKLLKDADILKNPQNEQQYNMMLNLIKGLESDQDFLNKYYFSNAQNNNPTYVNAYHDILNLLKSIFPNNTYMSSQPVRMGGVKSRKNKGKNNKKTRSYR